MSRLEELIQEFCPDGVEYKEIGSFADCTAGATPKTEVSAFWVDGTIPWMSSGEVNRRVIFDTDVKITEMGYSSCSTKMVPPNSVVIALAGQGKTRGLVAITRIPLCTNQSLCAIVTDSSMNSDFLYHFLRSQYKQLRSVSSGDGTRGGLNLSIIKSFLVPLPPLPVQEEIVRILDKFTALEAELEAELEARKKQYGYYLDFLLAHEPNCMPKYNIEWCSISEAFHFLNGYTPSTSDPSFWEDGTIPWFRMEDIRMNGRILSDSIQHITQNAVKGTLFPANSIILAISATIGEHALLTAEALSNQRFVCLAIKAEYLDKIDIKYFFYYCFLIDQWCLENTTLGNFLSVDMGKLRKLKIPLPPLTMQKRIVSILDRFDALVNDITQGLPAELAARRKQYEYYRDKLLTFKEKVS